MNKHVGAFIIWYDVYFKKTTNKFLFLFFIVLSSKRRIIQVSLVVEKKKGENDELNVSYWNGRGKGSTWFFQRSDLLSVINRNSNQIETFSIDDHQQEKLTLKNTISSIGHMPCSLDIDPSGKWLAVAKYLLARMSMIVEDLFSDLFMTLKVDQMWFYFHWMNRIIPKRKVLKSLLSKTKVRMLRVKIILM